MPDEPLPDGAAGLRAANARLRAVAEAKDAEIAVLRAGLDAARERERRLGLRLSELERRLGMDSTDSGTPTSKERIGAREARRARQESERERRKDRKRGGQPGHQGKGLRRDPDPGETETAGPPAECRACRTFAFPARTRRIACAFSVVLITPAHSPEQPTVVYGLPLQGGRGGPLHHQHNTATISAIFYIATSSRARGAQPSA